MLLSLFALALCFSFSMGASAHDYERSDGKKTYTHIDVSAEDVEMATAADKQATTAKFLLHAATHLDLIVKDTTLDETKQELSREVVIFSKRSRVPGEFNNGDTYIIGITERGSMTNHGQYKDLYGNRYFDDSNPAQEPMKTLITAGTSPPTPQPQNVRSIPTTASKDGHAQSSRPHN